MSKLRVALLFGGRSSEHSISCATAAGVMGAIDRDKYDLIPIGITQSGQFILADDDRDRFKLPAPGEPLPVVEFEGRAIEFNFDGSHELTLIEGDRRSSLGKIDVVFPVLHGQYGEDGTVQGLLELFGAPYVGNGVFASAAGMDKEFTKALFLQAGVPATPHVVVRANDMLANPEGVLEKVRNLGGLPLFVKPARAGSSVGVSKVSDWAQFGSAVADALKHDSKCVIEHGLIGREVEVAVLSGRAGAEPRVTVAGEIIVKGREFYDFEAKYRDDKAVDLVIPAMLTDAELREMQDIARRAFKSLDCSGLARVDFFLTADGFFVNEINTMPGFTPISMFPSLWQASGLAYSDLIDELIHLALER
ncbi:MAG: D-alanine--D-alanine ligase family protein [Novosphingobium sp.]